MFCFLAAENDTTSVRNVAITPDGLFDEICGYATQPIPGVGELIVMFPPPAPPGEYLILDTDYINFASVYSCSSFEIPGLGMVTNEQAWVLVRDPTNVTNDIMAQAFAAYADQGLDTMGFMPVSQENCTYENPTGDAECTGGNWNGRGYQYHGYGYYGYYGYGYGHGYGYGQGYGYRGYYGR